MPKAMVAQITYGARKEMSSTQSKHMYFCNLNRQRGQNFHSEFTLLPVEEQAGCHKCCQPHPAAAETPANYPLPMFQWNWPLQTAQLATSPQDFSMRMNVPVGQDPRPLNTSKHCPAHNTLWSQTWVLGGRTEEEAVEPPPWPIKSSLITMIELQGMGRGWNKSTLISCNKSRNSRLWLATLLVFSIMCTLIHFQCNTFSLLVSFFFLIVCLFQLKIGSFQQNSAY